MDQELTSLVRAVKNGAIRDTDRIRDILRDARQQIDRRRMYIDRKEELLLGATDAFVSGWSIKEQMT